MDFLQTGLLKILPQTVAILLLGYLGCKVLDMLPLIFFIKKESSF